MYIYLGSYSLRGSFRFILSFQLQFKPYFKKDDARKFHPPFNRKQSSIIISRKVYAYFAYISFRRAKLFRLSFTANDHSLNFYRNDAFKLIHTVNRRCSSVITSTVVYVHLGYRSFTRAKLFRTSITTDDHNLIFTETMLTNLSNPLIVNIPPLYYRVMYVHLAYKFFRRAKLYRLLRSSTN